MASDRRILNVGPLPNLPITILVRIWREVSRGVARTRRTLKHYILNAGIINWLIDETLPMNSGSRGEQLIDQRRIGWLGLRNPAWTAREARVWQRRHDRERERYGDYVLTPYVSNPSGYGR